MQHFVTHSQATGHLGSDIITNEAPMPMPELFPVNEESEDGDDGDDPEVTTNDRCEASLLPANWLEHN